MRIAATMWIMTLTIFLSALIHADDSRELVEPERYSPSEEVEFMQRIDNIWGRYVPAYKIHPEDPTEDCGKRYWSRLLALLKYAELKGEPVDSLIRIGRDLAMSRHAGSFQKPFSCAGFAMYYFNWKDSIKKYDPEQLALIEQRVDTMWRYLLRTDHMLDACCGYNEAGGKEFNSENFQWMLKCTGYLFSHNDRLNDTQTSNYNSMDIEGVEVHSDSEPRGWVRRDAKDMDVASYFSNSVKNLTRTLFNAGRVEWNSNNYFGHTLNPLHTLYQCALKTNDPEREETRKRAGACLDWMMTEAALHYRDGLQAAADSRAKTGSFVPLKGSYYPYTLPYFTPEEYGTSFSDTIWEKIKPSDAEIGFLLNSSYRPPKVVTEIANKEFPLPVEIRSAKPFYHIDKGEWITPEGLLTGKAAYEDWKGETDGRRFDFETLYISESFTMSSVATGRPDGREGTFSEECLWKIGIDGNENGAVIVCGNAGEMTTTAGRYPWHQIGQYRNCMMQLIKSPEYNKIWVAVPKKSSQILFDNMVCIDFGLGAYMALKASDGVSIYPIEVCKEAEDYEVIEFVWSPDRLGALVIEVNETKDYETFSEFITETDIRKIEIRNNRVIHTNAIGNTLEMEFVAPVPYLMVENTFDTPEENPLPNGGTYPIVFTDGQNVDFQSWESFKTVYGYPVVNQEWGSGCLYIKSNNRSLQIEIDPATANVSYFED